MKQKIIHVVIIIALFGIVFIFLILKKINDLTAELSFKKIRAAERSFRQAQGRYATLAELVQAGLLSYDFFDGMDSGYKYNLNVLGDKYQVTAEPVRALGSYTPFGTMCFFMDETGVIKVKGSVPPLEYIPIGNQ